MNEFLYKISKYKFIMDSEEMQLFLIKTVNSSKVISNLPKLRYEEIYKRYKNAFPDIRKEEGKESEKNILKVKNSIPFMKKIILNLKAFKESIKKSMDKRDNEANYYYSLVKVFENYEKYTLMDYVDNNEEKLVFYNPNISEINQKLTDLKNQLLKYHW